MNHLVGQGIFLLSNLTFLLVAYWLFLTGRYLEAIASTYFGLSAFSYHWRRCLGGRCFEAEQKEGQINLGVTVLVAFYLWWQYDQSYWAIVYLVSLAWLTTRYQRSEADQLLWHTLWHVLTPLGFYWLS